MGTGHVSGGIDVMNGQAPLQWMVPRICWLVLDGTKDLAGAWCGVSTWPPPQPLYVSMNKGLTPSTTVMIPPYSHA